MCERCLLPFPTMQIGITGASGLIGQSLIPRLRDAGHSIVAFSRSTDSSVKGAEETRVLNLETPPDLSELEAIVHLAGEPILGYWSKDKKRRLWESRVDLTKNLVTAINSSDSPPQTLVSASGVSLYGDQGSKWLDESAPKGSGYLSDIAEQWEAEAVKAKESGSRVVMLRLGAVLAKDGGMLSLVRKVFRFCLGGRLGSGRQFLSWIHLEDVVSIIEQAISNPNLEGPVNVCSPNPVTNREFTKLLAKAVNRPAFLPAPAFAIRLLIGGLSEVALQSQRCEPKALAEADFQFEFPELAAALEDLLN